MGLSFLLIDASFFSVRVARRNHSDFRSPVAQGKRHMQQAAIDRPSYGIMTFFVLTVSYVVGNQQPFVCEHPFGLGLRYRMFIDTLETVAIVPVESDDLAQVQHLCILT